MALRHSTNRGSRWVTGSVSPIESSINRSSGSASAAVAAAVTVTGSCSTTSTDSDVPQAENIQSEIPISKHGNLCEPISIWRFLIPLYQGLPSCITNWSRNFVAAGPSLYASARQDASVPPAIYEKIFPILPPNRKKKSRELYLFR